MKTRNGLTGDRATRNSKLHRRPFASLLRVAPLEDRTVPTFLAPVAYVTGNYPNDVATADFNGDGNLDLATANFYDSTVSVFLGNGDGTFQDGLASPSGDYPISLAVGDLDGDGNLDIATANFYDVTVLFGDGSGSFGAPNRYSAPYYPNSVAIGDFTGDGLLDLGVASGAYYGGSYGGGAYYGSVSVLIGNGTGGFSGPNTTYLGYGSFTGATTVNLDGVGADELLVTDSAYGYGTYVLAADSSNYLQVTHYLSSGTVSTDVAVDDVNADGLIDIVTANANYGSVSVFLGNSQGGFDGPQTFAAGSYSSKLAIGDFTGEGNLDIAVADFYDGKVRVLYGAGDGTFSNPVSASTGSGPYSIVAGQFDSDGRLDAATANLNDYTVSVLINDGNWPPPPPPPPPLVSIGNVEVTEGNSGNTSATFTISLSRASSQDVTVHYSTMDGSAKAGSDYTAASGDVMIPAGKTSYLLTIDVTGDRIGEFTEDFTVKLSAPVNAELGNNSQGVGTIYDDEPVISIGNVSINEGNTGSANATFTVFLSPASDVDVKVHYATADGTANNKDYTATSGDLTIPAGKTSASFSVAVLGDRVGEDNETFLVNLTSPVNARIGNDQAVGTIFDNEPKVSINDVTMKEGNGKSSTMTFTVRLSVAYDQTVTVNYATSSNGGTATAGVDYTAKSGSVTFAPGVTTQQITVTILADKTKEPNETFFVNLSGGTTNYFLFDPQGVGTIQDDDNKGKK